MKFPRIHPMIVVYSVAGICLIAKVWFMRRMLDLEVDVIEIIIPIILPGFHTYLMGVMKRRQSPTKFRWDHPGLWSAFIVVATILSVFPML